MKKHLFFLLFALTFLSACNFNSKLKITDPQAYDSFVDNLLLKLEKAERDLGLSYSTGISDAIESTYQNSKGLVNGLKKSADSLDTFKGDARFQLATNAYITFFKNAYEKEYREIVNIMKNSGISETDRQRFDQIYNQIETEKAGLRKELIESRQEFQKKYLAKN